MKVFLWTVGVITVLAIVGSFLPDKKARRETSAEREVKLRKEIKLKGEERKRALRQLAKLKRKLKVTKSERDGYTWVRGKYRACRGWKAGGDIDPRPYVGISQDGTVFLRLQVNYCASSWIWFKKLTVLWNGLRLSYTFSSSQVKREVAGSLLFETVDEPALGRNAMETMVRWMAQKKTVKLFVDGRSQYTKVTLSRRRKRKIRDLLKFYDLRRKL